MSVVSRCERPESSRIRLVRSPPAVPIQPAAEAIEVLVAEHKLRPETVARIVCRLPSEKSRVVDNRPMPDINVQYILSVILSDGRLTFNTAHDYDRLQAPDIRDVMSRAELIHDTGLDPAPNVKGFTRCGVVEVTMVDGRQLVHRVEAGSAPARTHGVAAHDTQGTRGTGRRLSERDR